MNIQISSIIREKCPQLQLGVLECGVVIKTENPELWAAVEAKTTDLQHHLNNEKIIEMPAIAATRRGYRALGKEPARYRASAEALLRRVVQGKGLYRINNVVDSLNLVSISTGFSIGGYDSDKIKNDIILDVGKADEPYEAIGRGVLNIEFLPVFRDFFGAFGSPTSDSVRTSVSLQTRRFLMIFLDFEPKGDLPLALQLAGELLTTYAQVQDLNISFIS